MRKLNLIPMIAIFLISVSAVEAYYVSVSPNPANTLDNLVCNTDTPSPYFYWYNTNNLGYVLSTSNTLQASSTTRYQTYRCIVKRYVGGQGLVVVGQDDRLISNAAPQITSFMLVNGTVGVPVTFTSSATDIDSDPLVYSWTFGDGFTGTGAVVAHTYSLNGTFPVTLAVTDGQGGSDSRAGNAFINQTMPPQMNYTIDLNSVQNNNQTQNLPTLEFDFINYSLPNSTNLIPGVYDINYTPQTGFALINWTATPNLVVANITAPVTTVNVTGNGTLTAVYSDIQPPNIMIWNPANSTYSISIVPINITATDNVAVSQAWYSIDGGANVTYSNATSSPALVNGQHTLVAYANDTSNNINTTSTDFTINVPPALYNITLNSQENNSATFNLGAITLNGTAYSLANSVLLPAGTYSLSFNSSAGYNFSYWNSTTSIVIGNISAISTNATVLGNGTITATYYNNTITNFTNVSNLPPNVTLLSPPNGTNFTTNNVSLQFHVEDDQSALLPACDLYLNGAINQTYTFVGNNTSPIFNLFNLADGDYIWSVGCNDGSLAGYSQNWTFNINVSLPAINYTINLTSAENSSLNSNLGVITFNSVPYSLPNTASAAAAAYSASYSPSNSSYYFDHWNVTGGLAITGGISSNPTTVNVFGNGTLAAVYAYNLTGGINGTSNTAPSVSLLAPPNGSNFTSSNVTLYYNVSDDQTPFLNCSLYINGAFNGTHLNVPDGATDMFNPLFSNGTYSWYVSCTDGALTNVSQTWLFNVNTSAPALHNVAISQTYAGSVYGIRINSTSGDILSDPANLTQGLGYSIRYRVDNLGTQPETVNIVVYSGSTLLAGYSQSISVFHIGNVPINASNLALGLQNVTVNATIVGFADANIADNFATREIDVLLQSSNTAPNVTLIWPANGMQINNTNTVGFNFTAVDGEQPVLSCSLYRNGTLASGPSAVLNNTLTTFTVSAMPFGAHSWNVSCFDGFLTSWSATWAFTLVNTSVADIIPPNIVLVPPTPANNSFQLYNWLYANATITDNVAVASALLEFNSANNSMAFTAPDVWHLNLTGIPDGSYSYKVWAVDTSGNWNVSETRYITINTTMQFNVINSFVNTAYYPLNISTQVPGNVINLPSYVQNSNLATVGANAVNNTLINNTNFTSSTALRSNLIADNILTSQINDSNLSSCYVSNSVVKNIVASGCSFVNSFVDPSNLTGSNVTGSQIYDSNATYSSINGSIIRTSNINGSYVDNSTITNSTLNNSTVINSSLTNVNANNSTIINSNLSNVTINNGFVNNSQLMNGSVTCQGQTYIYNGTPLNLTILCNAAPAALIYANPTSGNPTLNVLFEANSSYDPDGTIVAYYWDFGDSANSTNISQFHSYGSVGTYTAALLVTDNLGKNGTATVSISVTNPPSGGGSGGGGGGGSGGGGSGSIINVTTCTPRWECGSWTSCQSNGQQTRTCLDKNNCASIAGRPALYQSCAYSAPQATPVETSTAAKIANGIIKITGSVTSAPKASPLIGSAITAAIVAAGLLLFLAARRK